MLRHFMCFSKKYKIRFCSGDNVSTPKVGEMDHETLLALTSETHQEQLLRLKYYKLGLYRLDKKNKICNHKHAGKMFSSSVI